MSVDRFPGMLRLVYSASRSKVRTLDDEAMSWVVRLTSGASTQDDHEDFRRWRDQSPEHLEALDRARALWRRLGSALPEVQRRRARRRRRAKALGWAAPIAACLLLGLHFGYGYWTSGRFDQVTADGERRTVLMADGSRIVMSGGSALDVEVGHGVRRIDLYRGQIFVEARHDPLDPLVVHAGEARFRDVGTQFQVSRKGDGARLVVSEGLVEASRDDRRRLVHAGQAVAIGRGFGVVQAVDAQAETAWVAGRLVFRNQTLPQILAALAPYHRGRIVVLRRGADWPPLNATVDLDHVDRWLVAVEQMQDLRATRIAGYTFLT